MTERVRELARREERAGFTRLETLSVLRRAGQGDQAQAPGLPDRGQAGGQVDRRLRRAGQRATRCSTTAASAPTSSTTRWTAIPYKHGKFLPGTHIPIFPPDKIRETRPDYVLILPWNLKDEIREQLAYIREWGGQFVVPIPEVEVFQ